MVRLSYKKTEFGKESKPVLLGNELVFVRINLQTKVFQIVSVNTGDAVLQGEAASDAALTTAAKKILKDAGVKFDDEVRRRERSDVAVITAQTTAA